MKKYETPDIDVVVFDAEDVIVTSAIEGPDINI